eukprot:365942-Chlamydomonas_euryale.AAC.67
MAAQSGPCNNLLNISAGTVQTLGQDGLILRGMLASGSRLPAMLALSSLTYSNHKRLERTPIVWLKHFVSDAVERQSCWWGNLNCVALDRLEQHALHAAECRLVETHQLVLYRDRQLLRGCYRQLLCQQALWVAECLGGLLVVAHLRKRQAQPHIVLRQCLEDGQVSISRGGVIIPAGMIGKKTNRLGRKQIDSWR